MIEYANSEFLFPFIGPKLDRGDEQ